MNVPNFKYLISNNSRYPFDREAFKGNNFAFYALCIYEAFSGCSFGFYEYATDTFLFALLIYVDYQIRLLGLRISKVGHEGGRLSRREDIDDKLIDMVKMHIKIWE